jgi:hypothetical protein
LRCSLENDHGSTFTQGRDAQNRPQERAKDGKPKSRVYTAESACEAQGAAEALVAKSDGGSDALDLKRGVFTLHNPKRIAASLKRSAERSSRRKTGAYRSALSMLTFYVNRAGKTLPKTQRERLERAKVELKRQFGRE